MTPARLALACRRAWGSSSSLLPDAAHAWTPGTHIYLGESVLANLAQLPTAVADLLRAYPVRFPLRQHRRRLLHREAATRRSAGTVTTGTWARRSTIWRESDALRAFGLGYLCAPRRRHRRPQLLRAPPAHAHQQHGGRGPLLLGDPGRDPPRRRLRAGGQGRDPAGPRARPTRTSTGSSRRRSSACGPTAGSSAAWCASPRPPAGSAPAGGPGVQPLAARRSRTSSATSACPTTS